jgi:hypothetical protein
VGSEIERIAQGLVASLGEVPAMVDHLRRLAARCREQAFVASQLTGGSREGQEAALYLDAAARDCDQAAVLAVQAAARARAWAEGTVGPSGGSGGAPAQHGPGTPAGSPARVDLGAAPAGAEGAGPAGPADEEVLELSTTDPADRAALRSPPPERTIRVDGRFTYRTDGLGRVVRATATLGTVDLEHPRDGGAQRRLVGKLPGDHAGHIFARIFQGPSGTLNLVPMQSAKVNQGRYRSLENEWRKVIESGGTVDVTVEFAYSADSRRPHTIRVGHTSDGVMRWSAIVNEPSQEQTG